MPSKVSIILPTYNGSRYIRESIDSCLAQTFKNIELIIVDDSSTDATHEIIQSYKDPRIKIIRNETNQRLPRSLNIGFAAATGDFLTWTSDDNQFLPDAIEKMLDCLQNNEQVDLVYSDYYALYHETGKKELRALPDYPNLGRKNHIGACFLYTRRVYETLGGYDPNWELVEDYEYWIRIAHNFRLLHYPQPLYLYGEHAKSLKSTRQISILLFDSILRYQYGYTSLSELGRAIRLFIVALSESSLSGKERRQLWVKTFQRVFRLSFYLGTKFSILVVCASCVQLIRDRPSQDTNFNVVISDLRPSGPEKNVLCVVPYLVMGGAEQVVLNVVRGLTPLGYNFHLLAGEREDNQWCRNFSSHFKKAVLLSRSDIEKRYYDYLEAVIQKLNIEFLLISNGKMVYDLLPRLKHEFKRLKVIDILSAEKWVGTSKDYLWVSPFLDKRICISDHLKAWMTAEYRKSGFDSGIEDNLVNNLVTIRNGIDVKELSRDPSHAGAFKRKHQIPGEVKIISFVGRFSQEKDPFLFVEIARNLIAKVPQEKFRFVMAGAGPDFDLVTEHIKRAGMENHFILTGMLENVVELLTDTWALLVVSQSEGIPFVILEAQSMNVPVISTAVGAIHEAITDGVNGYLINRDANLVERFVSRILQLSTQEKDYRELASRARESVLSKFSMERMSKGYQKVIEGLHREKQAA